MRTDSTFARQLLGVSPVSLLILGMIITAGCGQKDRVGEPVAHQDVASVDPLDDLVADAAVDAVADAAVDAVADTNAGATAAADSVAAADVEKSPQAEPKADDPFEVPEGADAEELFSFISRVKMMRGRDLQSVTRSAKAATAAAAAIRAIDGVSSEDELKALREQLSALEFLQRYDPPSRTSLQELLASLKEDTRPEFRQIALLEGFKAKVAAARTASEEEQLQMISELNELIGDGDFDRDAYTLANSLASAISYSPSAHVAANLYDDMAAKMSESSDVSLQQYAPKMLGAARRVRLPGNLMEIAGTTTEGEMFDWESYRGKVVLVDFWASWCGPCRAEIPNMKRNLELYGDKGFAIVGVNLDNTLEDCEKYVEEQELTWTNLMSQKEDERGWNNPLANYYGISGIPTAILVDREGKVVSLKARGTELDRLLVELIGEVESEPPVSANDQNDKGDQNDKEDQNDEGDQQGAANE